MGARDHYYAVPIGDDGVTGLDKDATADNRTVDGFNFVSTRPNAPARFPEVKRDLFGGSRQKSRRSNFAKCGQMAHLLGEVVDYSGGFGTLCGRFGDIMI